MIERETRQGIADVDWTDDAHVQVWMRKRKMKYTVAEAKELRAELDEAIDEAERALANLLRPTGPCAFDVAHISPDCSVGKCAACIGTAWDMDADGLTDCTHECHQQAEAVAA